MKRVRRTAGFILMLVLAVCTAAGGLTPGRAAAEAAKRTDNGDRGGRIDDFRVSR
ncbi:hypothetical protein [Paenibacillus humicola]|uniref:hypothetical protein n=1 Tax=Paenibacillus humicola TaxID=3110540 RepID=UPI00237C1DD9|nr:hypothetical protein [Paenibacillus humicola]